MGSRSTVASGIRRGADKSELRGSSFTPSDGTEGTPGGTKRSGPTAGTTSPGQDEQLPCRHVEPTCRRRLAGHHGEMPVGVDEQAELPLLQLAERVDAAQLRP